MASVTITLELPAPTLAYAKLRADELDLSIEDWLFVDLDRQRKLHQETEEFFRIRKEQAIPGAWRAALAAIPNGPPDPGDELDSTTPT